MPTSVAKVRRGWACTLACLAATFLDAAPAAGAPDAMRVQITGNERTRTDYLEHLVRRCLSDFDPREG